MTEEQFWESANEAKNTGELAGIMLRDLLNTLQTGTYAFAEVSSNAPMAYDAIHHLSIFTHYHMPNNWLKLHGFPKRRRNHFLPHSWLKLHGNGKIPSYRNRRAR